MSIEEEGHTGGRIHGRTDKPKDNSNLSFTTSPKLVVNDRFYEREKARQNGEKVPNADNVIPNIINPSSETKSLSGNLIPSDNNESSL